MPRQWWICGSSDPFTGSDNGSTILVRRSVIGACKITYFVDVFLHGAAWNLNAADGLYEVENPACSAGGIAGQLKKLRASSLATPGLIAAEVGANS